MNDWPPVISAGGTTMGEDDVQAQSAIPRNVTRADVARLAGVSDAVVSYVVNNGPRPVAPATFQRVQEAIRVLGYRPNASARALRTGTTQLLGLVVPEIENPLFAKLARAIEDVAAARGFAVLVANSESNAAQERRHVANLIARQVDGLLLTSVLSRPVSALPLAGVSTVLLNAYGEVPGFPAVGVDAYAGAYEAVSHLVGHGYERIGLIIGNFTSGDVEPRERGWLQATRDAGLNDGPIARDEFSRRGGYQAGLRLFSGADWPHAVFVSSDMQAIGAMRALYELGLRVPEDVALFAFDGTEETEYTNPQLSVVRQPVREMAEDAVEKVLNPSGPASPYTAHKPELVFRRSCGCDRSPASATITFRNDPS
jgi:LacI family transcriptional regulator